MRTIFLTSIMILLAPGLTRAQQPDAVSQDATIQALLKEVHALRLALEMNNKIGPRIQIAIARMQFEEQRVRDAIRQLQEARDRVSNLQRDHDELAARIKMFEADQAQTTDPNARKQEELQLTEGKTALERFEARLGDARAKEAEANTLLLNEQSRWSEASDALTSIERALAQPQQ